MYQPVMKSMAIAGVMTLALWAAPFWVSKPYTQWTEKEVEKILGDSPWMQSADVSFDPSAMQGQGGRIRMGGPGGGMGGPGGAGGPGDPGGMGGGMRGPGGGPGGGMGRPEVHVMWQSALPIRQAMARAAALKESPAAESLERQVAETPEHHVLAVMGLPGGPGGMRMARGPGAPEGGDRQMPSPEQQEEMRERMQAQLRENSYLVVDGTKILTEKVETVVSGSERVMLFYFPKTVELTSKTKSATFQTSMGPLKIEAKFKPKDMLF